MSVIAAPAYYPALNRVRWPALSGHAVERVGAHGDVDRL